MNKKTIRIILHALFQYVGMICIFLWIVVLIASMEPAPFRTDKTLAPVFGFTALALFFADILLKLSE